MFKSLILSCEHAGNEVPDNLRYLFAKEKEVLNTHQGWDIGAWELAQFLSKKLSIDLSGCHTTRLLIEANRSLDSTHLFSEYSSVLSNDEKENLVSTIYKPYRDKIQQQIEKSAKPVLHLSIHSFTPIWHGVERAVDIGILFDPDRKLETNYCQQLKLALEEKLPNQSIKLNEPYKGTDDGFTTWLRKRYDDKAYAGIELEVNQKYASRLPSIKREIFEAVETSLK